MRTTLTLDDDVASGLRRLQKERGLTFKELVNQALREGVQRLEAGLPEPVPFKMVTADLGTCRLPNLDNVAEILALVEGEDFR